MVLTATTISTTQLIVTPTTVMEREWAPIGIRLHTNWQDWGYKSYEDCYNRVALRFRASCNYNGTKSTLPSP